MSAGTISSNRTTGIAAAASAVLLAALLQFCSTPALAAVAPYEPNDSSAAAYGPLESGQPVAAAIESSSDRDFFYFYVTASEASPISVTVHSLGGNSLSASGLNASLLDVKGSSLASMSFIRDGETTSTTVPLQAQKYFVEVSPSEGFGDSYELSVAGPPGAVGPFSQIAARCADAEAGVERREAAVGRVESKLLRVVARLHRSQLGSKEELRGAQVATRKARAAVRRQRDRLREARAVRRSSCSIAP